MVCVLLWSYQNAVGFLQRLGREQTKNQLEPLIQLAIEKACVVDLVLSEVKQVLGLCVLIRKCRVNVAGRIARKEAIRLDDFFTVF